MDQVGIFIDVLSIDIFIEIFNKVFGRHYITSIRYLA